MKKKSKVEVLIGAQIVGTSAVVDLWVRRTMYPSTYRCQNDHWRQISAKKSLSCCVRLLRAFVACDCCVRLLRAIVACDCCVRCCVLRVACCVLRVACCVCVVFEILFLKCKFEI